MSSSPTATTPATEKKPDASPTTTPAAAPEEELFKVSYNTRLERDKSDCGGGKKQDNGNLSLNKGLCW